MGKIDEKKSNTVASDLGQTKAIFPDCECGGKYVESKSIFRFAKMFVCNKCGKKVMR